MGCVKETIPESRNEPYNQDHLTTLRRSFHTLKGSGRMVGLNAFGEAAWSIEQVLNLRLSETRAGDADLYGLLNKAVEVLSAWVEDLQTQGRSDRTPTALVRAAERLKAGGGFVYEEAAPAPQAVSQTSEEELIPAPSAPAPMVAEAVVDEKVDADFVPEIVIEEEISMSLPQAEEITLSDADMAAFRAGDGAVEKVEELPQIASPEAVNAPGPIAEVIDFPAMLAPEVKRDDNVKRIGDIEISVPLHNIYLAETDELVRFLSQDVAEWRHEPDRHVNTQAVHAAHSLAGSSATVGFKSIQEVAHGLEMVLQYLSRKPVKLNDTEYDTLEHSIERIRFMLQMFALGEMPDHEPQQVQILSQLLNEISARAEHKPEDVFALPPVGISAEVIAAAQEQEEQERQEAARQALTSVNSEPELLAASVPEPEAFIPQEAEAFIPQEPEAIVSLEVEPFILPEPAPAETIEPAPAALPEPDPIGLVESVSAAAAEPEPEPEPEQPEPVVTAQDFPAFAEPEPIAVMAPEPPVTVQPRPAIEAEPEPQFEVQPEPVSSETAAESLFVHEEAGATDPALMIKDELDPDLLPVFLEEGRDMLPQMGQALRTWPGPPDPKPSDSR